MRQYWYQRCVIAYFLNSITKYITEYFNFIEYVENLKKKKTKLIWEISRSFSNRYDYNIFLT